MRFFGIPILLLLLMTQAFSHWFVVMSFKLNQDYIAKNLCENRYRPKLNCKGNCVLMKKLKQQEKEEQNAPAVLKTELPSIIVSSKSFFLTIDNPASVVLRSYLPRVSSGKPVDRTFSVFHPPAS
jgi:hypothetical protein